MQINQYTQQATGIDNNDWLDMDKNLGGGNWESQKLDLATLGAGLGSHFIGWEQNLSNTDLHQDADRTFYSDSYNLAFHVNEERHIAGSVASSGNSNFEFDGNATLASDVAFRVSNFGNTILESYGDSSTRFYGTLGVNILTDPDRIINIEALGSDFGIYCQSINAPSGYFNSTSNIAVDAVAGGYCFQGQHTSGNSISYICGSDFGMSGNGSAIGGKFESASGIGAEIISNSGTAIRITGKAVHRSIGVIYANDPSALVQFESTTQGILFPRMTGAQAEAISSPGQSLAIFSTDGSGATITSMGWWGFDGTSWVKWN